MCLCVRVCAYVVRTMYVHELSHGESESEICICVYIYIYREREMSSQLLCIHIHTYIYIYTQPEREREMSSQLFGVRRHLNPCTLGALCTDHIRKLYLGSYTDGQKH